MTAVITQTEDPISFAVAAQINSTNPGLNPFILVAGSETPPRVELRDYNTLRSVATPIASADDIQFGENGQPVPDAWYLISNGTTQALYNGVLGYVTEEQVNQAHAQIQSMTAERINYLGGFSTPQERVVAARDIGITNLDANTLSNEAMARAQADLALGKLGERRDGVGFNADGSFVLSGVNVDANGRYSGQTVTAEQIATLLDNDASNDVALSHRMSDSQRATVTELVDALKASGITSPTQVQEAIQTIVAPEQSAEEYIAR